jgi:hypothetical protein
MTNNKTMKFIIIRSEWPVYILKKWPYNGKQYTIDNKVFKKYKKAMKTFDKMQNKILEIQEQYL